ncbi:hypothetical protein REC12_08525 [Desulfosporosinus sp. PR]|uniref:hypothetical protein n=1 Tax=Candidatus Desulfosporosinus nitrosoreducens TaxID=3401928 RepID=UPI0027E6CCB6|nr:hypothetical protein [Desulfosporosinus sp. PR]MDQ7093632.1 hypothetical protein [Desulfosporosinus sp. PR]
MIIENFSIFKKLYLYYLLFAFVLSIFDIFLGCKSNWVSFLYGRIPNKFEGLMISGFFLFSWLLYGIITGYTERKGFIKFLLFFWVTGGSISLIANLMAPIGKFTLLLIPVDILILVPNYGLKPYLLFSSVKNTNNLLFIFLSVLFSWLMGFTGYILGNKFKNLLDER